MARYELTSPDGKRFEVTAPDDAKEEDVLSYFQKQVGNAPQAPYGSKEDVKAEAARRQEKEGPGGRLGYTNATGMDTYTIGHGAQVFGGIKGVTNYAVKKFKGEEADLSTEYARERDIMAAQIRDEEERAGPIASTAGSITMGLASAPAKAAGTALNALHGTEKLARPAYTAAEQAASRLAAEKAAEAFNAAPVRNFLVDKAKVAGYGAGFGAIYGEGRETGDLAEKVQSAKDHAIAGAILAPVVKTGLDAVGAYRGYRADKKQARADTANERAQVFEAADARPFTPALNDNASLAARAIEGNIAAEPLRRSARMTLDDLEKGLERHFKGASEGMTPSETGDRLRMFLREQLLGENGNSTMIKAQTPEELATLSGVQPLKPPKVEPTKPERIPTMSQEEYLQGVAQAVPEAQPQLPANIEGRFTAPKIEDVVLPDELLKRAQKTHAEHADLGRKLEAKRKVIDEQEGPIVEQQKALGMGEMRWTDNGQQQFYAVEVPGKGYAYADHTGKIWHKDTPVTLSPEQEAWIRNAADYLQHQPRLKAEARDLENELVIAAQRRRETELEAAAYRNEMLPQLTEQRRQTALKEAQEMAQSEAALATQKAREEAVERARPQAQADALKATQKAQAEENARAAAETALRQAQATAEHSRNVGKPFELGDSPLPVKSQLDAAYEQVRRNAPAMQPNLLGDRATKTKPEMRTNTTKLIDDIAIEARRRNEMPGYRDGEIFEPGDVGVQPRIMDYLRERLGDNIVGRLEEYAAKRSSNQLPPNIRGLVDLRSDLRRMSRDSYTGAPGEPRKPDTAMMTRMADSVDKDIRAFARAQGEQGAAWVRQLDQVDAQYSRYLNDMRAPLAKILDEKTDSAGIYQKLVSSMREGTTSVDTLRRVYDLVDLKGSEKLNRANLTGALLADMGRDGLPGFLKAWSKLSPDAKAIMFKDGTEALGSKLEAISKAGNLMESHMGVAANGELSPTQLMRTSNVLLGTLAYAHAPAAITSALGINVASRILSSKWYAGWLRSAPVKSIGGPEWTRHMDRMVGYAGEMTGNNPEAVRALRETIGIKDANALFLGEKSETANKDALEEAKALEKKRTNPKDIYHKTGWFKGRDNVWRYEIDDKPTKLTSEANAYFKHVHKKLGDIDTTLGTLIKHDELFKAFPDAKNIKVRLMRTKQANEAADMGDNELAHTWGALWDSPTKTMIVNAQAILSREDLRSVLLHETQHYLQDVNGFDYGPLSGDYERRYGEVEAYNVQKREPMDAEQRRRSYPPSTQGVSMKDILLSRKRQTADAK